MLRLLLLFLAYGYQHNVADIESNVDIPENERVAWTHTSDLNNCDTQGGHQYFRSDSISDTQIIGILKARLSEIDYII